MGSLDKNQASDRLMQSLNFISKIKNIALENGAWLLRKNQKGNSTNIYF